MGTGVMEVILELEVEAEIRERICMGTYPVEGGTFVDLQ